MSLITGALLLGAGYAAVTATVLRGDIALSAFFGIRASADPLLGAISLALALVPWITGIVVWRALGRGAGAASQWLLAFGAPGSRGRQIRVTALTALLTGIIVVVASTPVI